MLSMLPKIFILSTVFLKHSFRQLTNQIRKLIGTWNIQSDSVLMGTYKTGKNFIVG